MKDKSFHQIDDYYIEKVPKPYIENPLNYSPQPIAIHAVSKLQSYLCNQTDFQYGFGWDGNSVGKMLGVLVVENTDGIVGYLAAYSGKIFNQFDLSFFVPPIYNMFDPNSFYFSGEKLTKSLNDQYHYLLSVYRHEPTNEIAEKLSNIRNERQKISRRLQQQLFESYIVTNNIGVSKTIKEIFKAQNIIPKAGSGDCAAIRLLNHAYKHKYTPIALAEFWWGAATPSKSRIHKSFYTACQEKCAPILNFMHKHNP